MADTIAPTSTARRVRTTTVLQLEAVECGAASLAMILAAHGRWVPLEELRMACGVSRNGSSAGNIVRAARAYGLEAKGFRYDLNRLQSVALPAILFVNLNHFLVLEGFRGGKVFLNDPAAGRRVLSSAEFDRIYSGIVLTFTPTASFQKSWQRPGVLGRLNAWLQGGHPALAYVALAGASLTILAVIVPSLTRIFIDHYLIGEQKGWIVWLLVTMVAAALVQGCLTWLKSTILQRLDTRIAIRAAAQLVWRMMRLPVSFYSQRYAGSIANRIELAPSLSMHAAGEPAILAVETFSLAFFAFFMIGYSPFLTAIAAACAGANLILFLLTRRRMEERQQKATLDQVKLGGKTMQGLQMMESLKASGTEGPYFESWAGQHALVAGQQQEIGRIGAQFAVLPEFLAQLGTVLVLVVGGWLVMQGHITIGTLVAFQLLQASFNAPITTLMQTGLQFQSARGTLDQFDDVLKHKLAPEFTSDESESTGSGPASATPLGIVQRLSGHVSVRGLTFGYNPLEKPLIENFDLDLVSGSRIALVGPSGSGKSTVGKLVTGLLQPWSGEIRFDGEPLASLPRTLVRNSLAVVDQEVVLFEGTVRDNIALWDETMPDNAIVKAAKAALIHDTIVRRPNSYESRIEEGGRNFSGGQRQRIEIARALVTNPTVLVLDEATSALDPVAEKEIMDNLRRRGCTCLIIAHSLSTIRDCDEIIVMNRGAVLERGTHETLVKQGGTYRHLVEA